MLLHGATATPAPHKGPTVWTQNKPPRETNNHTSQWLTQHHMLTHPTPHGERGEAPHRGAGGSRSAERWRGAEPEGGRRARQRARGAGGRC